MDLPRPSRDEALLAAASGGWAGFFLAGTSVAAALSSPLLVASAVLPYRRRPVDAAVAVAIVTVLLDRLAGVPSENPWPLAAVFVVVYALGRYTRPARSIGPLVVLLAAFVVADPAAPTVVFGGLLLGAIWAFGHLVRRRTVAAETAAATVSQLAALDPGTRAERAVAEERARLAGETLAVIRAAVETMLHNASEAAVELDRVALDAVQDEGRRATSELRRLLGLLRSEPEPVTPPLTRPVRRGWRRDLVAAGGLMVFCFLEIGITPGLSGSLTAATVACSLALAATVALRRVDPAVACTVAIVPPTVALALDLTLPYGVWTAVVAGLLAWSATTAGHLRGVAALVVFSSVLVLDTYRHHPGNEAMMLAVIALAAIAGHLWAARDREERSASVVAAELRAAHEAVAERAVHAERLRLARDLHDVTSHAVGVMVLQAAAAAALRDQVADQARAAVANVQAAGARALSELDVLFGLLDAGAVGAAGLANSAADTGLAARLDALTTRMQAAGLRIHLTLDAQLATDPQLTATTYRVVQEALTNVVRHAPDARVEVEVTERTGVLEVCVRDDGAAHAPAPIEAGGYGLVGLEERVRFHGGELVAARRPEGGFVVTARLPVEVALPEAHP